MKIECTLKRPGGTKVTIGKTEYHFQPSPETDGAHCAEVEDGEHIARFLSITEAYKVHGAKAKTPVLVGAAESSEVDSIVKPPEKMTNDDLNRWAKDRGFNPKSKVSIRDYAEREYGVVLETKGVQPAALVRQVVQLEIEKLSESEDYGFEIDEIEAFGEEDDGLDDQAEE